MLYYDIILQVCNNYGLGKDVAHIIHNYVLYLYCPALQIKQELFKYVNLAIATFKDNNFITRNDGFHSTGGGYGIMHRNIAGSYLLFPVKKILSILHSKDANVSDSISLAIQATHFTNIPSFMI